MLCLFDKFSITFSSQLAVHTLSGFTIATISRCIVDANPPSFPEPTLLTTSSMNIERLQSLLVLVAGSTEVHDVGLIIMLLADSLLLGKQLDGIMSCQLSMTVYMVNWMP